VSIIENQITETRSPQRRIGIRLGASTGEIRLVDNRIEGCATPVSDLRQAG
jgi:hypothetical protein